MKYIFLISICFFVACNTNLSTKNSTSDLSDSIKIIKLEYSDSIVTPMQRADFGIVYFDFNELNNPLKDSVIYFFNHVISENNKSIKEVGREFVNSILLDSVSANYSLKIEMNNEKETKDYFILNKSEYSYLGGAHPNSTFQYIMFNKQTGVIAKIEDILKKTEWNSFVKVNEKYFKIARGIDDTTSINNIEGLILGNEIKALPFASSWYFDEFGLHVNYNQYEVLCYAAGTTEYLIPISELKHFLK